MMVILSYKHKILGPSFFGKPDVYIDDASRNKLLNDVSARLSWRKKLAKPNHHSLRR